MTPEDFAEVFPDLEFFAYSSWSHTPDARRYRIGIPSTQLIPPEIHALILHTIVDRLEAAGWGDALSDGKKHGVDIGKLHEAAMFYLPSKRPDCFLHAHPGGPQTTRSTRMGNLDPRRPAGLATTTSSAGNLSPRDTPAHKDKRVQWAIDYWRKCGCVKGKGRTQLWLLAKRLAEAGCDDAEMRVILHEQAGLPPIRGSDAGKSKRCCEITMSSLQGARRDDSKDQDFGRSGRLKHHHQEFQTPSSAAPAIASASQQFPPAAPSECARPAFAPCPRSAPPGPRTDQHRQGKPY